MPDTNAFKHGFAQGGAGTVRVRFQPLAGEVWRLEVVDEVEAAGEGPPLDLPPSSGLGMQLVEGFARQLGGTVEVERAPRFRVLVDLPLRAEPGPAPGDHPTDTSTTASGGPGSGHETVQD